MSKKKEEEEEWKVMHSPRFKETQKGNYRGEREREREAMAKIDLLLS